MNVKEGDWVMRIGYPKLHGFPQTFKDVLPNTSYLVTETDDEKESVTIRVFKANHPLTPYVVEQTFWAGNFNVVELRPAL